MALRLKGQTTGYVELAAPATAADNTLTLPNGNGTNGQVLATNGSGTLSFATVQAFDADTAKTDIAQTFTASQRGEITTLTSGSTVTPDFAASNNFTLTLGESLTFANPTNLVAGQSGSIFLVQDGTGSRVITWGSYFDWAGGSAPDISTAAGSVDRLDYLVRTTTSIHGVITLDYS